MAGRPKERGKFTQHLPNIPFVVKRLGPDAVADWEERAAIIAEACGLMGFEAECRATECVLEENQRAPYRCSPGCE